MSSRLSHISILDSVTRLRGVGPRLAAQLEKLNIRTLQDVLLHLPLRYQDRTRIAAIGHLRPGDEVMIEGDIEFSEIVVRKRRSLLCHLADNTGRITLRFFHFSSAQQQTLVTGQRLRCFGEVRYGYNSLEMVHPEYQAVNQGSLIDNAEDKPHLTPIYPSTEGVHQLRLRQITEQALQVLANTDHNSLYLGLPQAVEADLQLPSFADAVEYVHRPPPDASLSQLSEGKHPAQQRLAFEELLAHQLSMQQLRQHARQDRAPVIAAAGELPQQCRQQLPFPLTRAQNRVIAEIVADMRQPQPMLRLVQGDVGSGKTLVAVMAALNVIEAGYQVAVMAPTELLAEQHLRNFTQWLEPLGCQIAWLASKLKAKQKQSTLAAIAAGNAQVIIGTHALFQDQVQFAHLGLLVVDEQHRFGVQQRLALQQKGVIDDQVPHQLTMTATPIPRTLAMTAYADLDCSVIDELPPGRQPVTTVVLSEQRRAAVIERIAHACKNKQQAYWVCTLIDDSEVLQCQAAEHTADALTAALPGLRIGLVHGRLKSADKTIVMQAFQAGEIDVLVATTVIEVGVDVPNASLMVIENAERLGLAQLHQLRGRVGRGQNSSHCVLMYKPPLSQKAQQRLAIMREHNDGFEIAQQDLKMRGPGELLGARQTGLIDFHIADIVRDANLLPQIQHATQIMLRDHKAHTQALIQRWVGDKQQFRRV